jgi:hypothetical protein
MVSPFNFPLNLAAHKVAPALAVGYALAIVEECPTYLPTSPSTYRKRGTNNRTCGTAGALDGMWS